MSNQSNDFNTPPGILEPIYKFWPEGIDLDPCSNKTSMVKSKEAWGLPVNGLVMSWAGRKRVFVNPPYAPYYLRDDGEDCISPKQYKDLQYDKERYTRYTIYDWLSKGLSESNTTTFARTGSGLIGEDSSVESIFLIPCRGMGSKVWQKIILPYHSGICFLKKRFPFWEDGAPCKGPNGDVNPGTFDCALVHFGGNAEDFRNGFSHMGYVQEEH